MRWLSSSTRRILTASNKHIIRTSAKTTQTHPGTLIVTQVDRVEATDKDDKPILGPDKKPVFVYTPKKYEPLLSWYIKDARRREKHRIGVYFTEAEERKHPNDLNVSAGLPFDERFENEPIQERTAFVDPFDEEPDWKTLDGLDFLLWHMKYNLHDGDAVAFAYTMQLLAYSLQYRIKSGVLILFTGVQGTGKTAVFGQNESGPGVYMRIYGDCGMQYNNIDALLKDFNADACGKLYCLLEEANPGNNTRNNNQLKDVITGGRQRIERKGVDAFHVDDCRSFVSCSQDVPFKIEQGDRRFVVNRTRDKFSPTGVKNGDITQEEFVEFGRKLDRTKNDNEVAYELFAMVMRLDLSAFDKTRLPVTEAKTEQQNETSCKVTAWIERVAKLEFYDPANQFEEYFEFENDKIVSLKKCRLPSLFQRYKIWYAAAYPGTWLEPRNENSFAKALTKIPDLVTMKKTKICNLYTVLCPEYVGKEIDEVNDDDAEPEAKRQKSADF